MWVTMTLPPELSLHFLGLLQGCFSFCSDLEPMRGGTQQYTQQQWLAISTFARIT